MPTYAVLIPLVLIIVAGLFCMTMDLVTHSDEQEYKIVYKSKKTPKKETYLDDFEADSELFDS